MNSRSLRDRVIIEQRADDPEVEADRNELNELVSRWAAVAECWANVEGLSGREFWSSQQSQSAVSHTVTIRYRGWLTTRHRLRWDGRTLNIESMVNPDGKKVFLEIRCVEKFDQQQAREY